MRLAEWREKRGVTQQELSVATGISTSTIRRLENPDGVE
jgi:transcriptional regulator with XRE-family HTH domain